MTSALTASSFTNGLLNATATQNAVLYQRNAVNVLNGSAKTPVNIGQLTSDQTQLDVTSKVTPNNQNDFYTFNFQGNKTLKANLQNLTNSEDLRLQLTDSKGNVVADNNGTAAQQIAYVQLTTATGLTANAGQYSIKVSYATTAPKGLPQTYNLALYSGTQFNAAYQTTAAEQDKPNTFVPVDNTQTYATNDANLFSRQGFHTIGETISSAVNIGWLSENKARLDVQSQLTPADSSEFYKFTLQKGSDLKFAFNNTTNSSALRVQITDSSGYHIIADNKGTAAQQAAYASITSSTGVAAKPGTYAVKVTYAAGANKGVAQNYNFQVYSGTSYSNSYQTIASAQTYGNAVLSGNTNVAGYNAASAAAAYLTGAANGTSQDLLTTLATTNQGSNLGTTISLFAPSSRII